MATEDLSWLATAKPREATFKPTKRGRQPGTNPMDVHVHSSFDQRNANGDGKVLKLDVPASQAQKAERLLRRSAARNKFSISVQVWDKNEKVIPLKEINDLPDGTDVTLVFSAGVPREKAAKPEADKLAATEDPFASAPTDVPAENGKATRKGGKVPTVANP